MSFTYDGPTRLITLTASTGRYMFLIDSMKERLESALGVAIPTTSAPESDFQTATASVTISTELGLRSFSVGLGGSITAAALVGRIGVEWPLESDALTIYNPVVSYQAEPIMLGIAMQMDVPALGLNKVSAALAVTAGPTLDIQVRTQLLPVRVADCCP